MSTLTVCYDLKHCPPTYDFVGFLVSAEHERIKRGYDKVAISFIPGLKGGFRDDQYWPYTVAEREEMLARVVIPMAHLLPSLAFTSRHTERSKPQGDALWFDGRRYGTDVMVWLMHSDVFPLRAKPLSLHPKSPYVTITLREADHWPTRNSNLEEWLKVGEYLREKGFTPVFVRDATKAEEKLKFLTHAGAAVSLDTRASLYAGAHANLFVNNGPAWMCLFMGLPTLICKLIAPDAPCTDPGYWEHCRLPVGSQIPNAKEKQKLLWTDDNADDIIGAVEEIL